MNHGAGSGNIQYWGISDRDANAAINTYKTTYGITNPCAGTSGNGNTIINSQYANSFTFTGFPTYSVICPNHTINWDVNWPPSITGFDTYFSGCGSTNVEFNPTTTKFTTLYPNPASSKVNIDFYLDQASDITLEVYNVTGQKVYTSTATHVDAGFNFTNLAVDDFTNGVYIVKLLQGQNVVDVRMLSVTK